MNMNQRPNILWIISDEHNPHIAGYMGDEKCSTEHLDQLAQDSTRFDFAYCQSPLCIPSRLSMLTGKYVPACTGCSDHSHLDATQTTVAEHLSKHGYTTALVGKMHMQGPGYMAGFDHRPYGDLAAAGLSITAVHQPDPPETWDGQWNNHGVGRFPFAGETKIPESLLCDAVASREALSFLLEHNDQTPESPWMMCVGYSRPHFPLTAPGRYVRRALASITELPCPVGEYSHPHDQFIAEDFSLMKFTTEEHIRALACYYACLDYVDDCIGELLEGLARAGLLENTVVVYTSDHGDMAGEHGLWWKRTYYEASAKVPLLIKGPGIKTQTISDCPVELVDLFPTFCDIAQIPTPAGLDGESLLPLCQGVPQARSKTTARSELLDGKPETRFRMVRNQRWKYVEFPNAPARLFDMQEDPGENIDLLASGEVGSAPVEELKQLVQAGLSWEAINTMKKETVRNRPKIVKTKGSPVQYQLADGRIVDADKFLYPGLD